MKDSMVWSAVVTHQAVMICVWVCVFAYMHSDLYMPSVVFIHLMNLNRIGPLLTPPTWCTIIHNNRERERVCVRWEGRERPGESVERSEEGKTARRGRRESLHGWLPAGCVGVCVCLKSVLRGERDRRSSPCLIRRTLVCPRLIVSWAPQGGGPPLHQYTSGHADSCRSSPQRQRRGSHWNQDFGL